MSSAGEGGGGGGGVLNFPLPVPCTPGSRPFRCGSASCAFSIAKYHAML